MNKNNIETLTQKEVQKLFIYDKDTGKLFWRPWTSKNRTSTIKEVISLSPNGYKRTCINYKQYYAHRIIWLYIYGYFPENYIDHINRDTTDNRLENLREVSQQCNLRNAKVRCNNKSDITGLNWNPRNNNWIVRIKVAFKEYYLGSYKDYYEAACVRLAVEQCLNWEGCDSSSSAYKVVKKYLIDSL